MKLRERIENHPIVVTGAALLLGFLAGLAAYEGLLRIARLHVISEHEYRNIVIPHREAKPRGNDKARPQRPKVKTVPWHDADRPSGSPDGPKRNGFPKIHVVREGDTLWVIAKQYYGDGRYWRIIVEANSEAFDGDRFNSGMTIKIPDPPQVSPAPEGQD